MTEQYREERMVDLDEAIDFMIEKHRGQRRYPVGSGVPYVSHTFEVAKRVSGYLSHPNEDRLLLSRDEMYVAALWHDLLEDCDCTEQEILERSNERVLQVVKECTRPEDLGKGFHLKYRWLEGFREKSLASVVIKIADRACNVGDYLSTPAKRAYAAKYALQAYPLYGIYQVNGKNPEVFDDIGFLDRVVAGRYDVSMLALGMDQDVSGICAREPQQDKVGIAHHPV
jgi:(p)ppGpp synthase/HD superfamily hydrolase